MKHIVCAAFILAFAACSALQLVAKSGDRHFGESEPLNPRVSVTPQNSAEGGSTADPVLKASSQVGKTADVQINNAIGVMAHRNGIVSADYSTNQTWAACPAWGTQNFTLALYPVTYAIATNCTIPPNVTLQFSHGSCLAPATGTTTTIKAISTLPCPRSSATL
jgi:hypothetical protein